MLCRSGFARHGGSISHLSLHHISNRIASLAAPSSLAWEECERRGDRQRGRERERERESALHWPFGWYLYRPGEEGTTSIRLLVAIGRGRGVATMLSMAVVVVKGAVCMGIPPRRRRRLRRMVYGVLQSGLKGASGDSGDI